MAPPYAAHTYKSLTRPPRSSDSTNVPDAHQKNDQIGIFFTICTAITFRESGRHFMMHEMIIPRRSSRTAHCQAGFLESVHACGGMPSESLEAGLPLCVTAPDTTGTGLGLAREAEGSVKYAHYMCVLHPGTGYLAAISPDFARTDLWPSHVATARMSGAAPAVRLS